MKKQEFVEFLKNKKIKEKEKFQVIKEWIGGLTEIQVFIKGILQENKETEQDIDKSLYPTKQHGRSLRLIGPAIESQLTATISANVHDNGTGSVTIGDSDTESLRLPREPSTPPTASDTKSKCALEILEYLSFSLANKKSYKSSNFYLDQLILFSFIIMKTDFDQSSFTFGFEFKSILNLFLPGISNPSNCSMSVKGVSVSDNVCECEACKGYYKKSCFWPQQSCWRHSNSDACDQRNCQPTSNLFNLNLVLNHLLKFILDKNQSFSLPFNQIQELITTRFFYVFNRTCPSADISRSHEDTVLNRDPASAADLSICNGSAESHLSAVSSIQHKLNSNIYLLFMEHAVKSEQLGLNHKNFFIWISCKLIDPILNYLNTHQNLLKLHQLYFTQYNEMTKNIISTLIVVPKHHHDLVSVLESVSRGEKPQSYPKSFTSLLITRGISGVWVYPTVLESFINNCDKTDAGERGFLMYNFLQERVMTNLEACSLQETIGSQEAAELKQSLEIFIELLCVLVPLRVYKRTLYNSVLKQHFKWLIDYTNSKRGLYNGSADTKTNAMQMKMKMARAKGIEAVLKLDYTIITDTLPLFIENVVSPPFDDTFMEWCGLAGELVKGYAKAAELPQFLSFIFTELRAGNGNENCGNVFKSKEVLESFGMVVGQMPVSGVDEILSCLESELSIWAVETGNENNNTGTQKRAHISDNRGPLKRVRISDGSYLQVAENGDERAVEVAAALYIYIISVMQIGTECISLIEQGFVRIYDNVVVPVWDRVISGSSNHLSNRIIVASIQVHVALMQYSSNYWNYWNLGEKTNKKGIQRVIGLVEWAESQNSGNGTITKGVGLSVAVFELLCRYLDCMIGHGQKNNYDASDVEKLVEWVWRKWRKWGVWNEKDKNADYQQMELIESLVREHIWSLSLVSSSHKLDRYVKYRARCLLRCFQGQETAIQSEKLEMYDIPCIKSRFPSDFLLLLAGFVGVEHGVIGEYIASLAEECDMSEIYAGFQSVYNCEIGSVSISAERLVVYKRVQNVFETLGASYFNPVTQEKIQIISFLLEKVLIKGGDSCLLVSCLYRRNMWIYVHAREKRAATLFHSSILEWYISSTLNYRFSVISAHAAYYTEMLIRCTMSLIFQTLELRGKGDFNQSQPQTQPQAKPQKYAALTTVEYITHIIAHVNQANSYSKNGSPLNVLEVFVSAILAHTGGVLMRHRSKDDDFKTVDCKKARKLVLKFIKKYVKDLIDPVSISASDGALFNNGIVMALFAVCERLGLAKQASKIIESLKFVYQDVGVDTAFRISACAVLFSTSKEKDKGEDTEKGLEYLKFLVLHNSGTKSTGTRLSTVIECFFQRNEADKDKCLAVVKYLVDLIDKSESTNDDLDNGRYQGPLECFYWMVTQPRGFGRLLRPYFSRMLVRFAQIIHVGPCLDYIRLCFEIATIAVQEHSFGLSDVDVLIILSFISSYEANFNFRAKIEKDSHLIFKLLEALIRHERKSILTMIPPFLDSIFTLMTNDSESAVRILAEIGRKPVGKTNAESVFPFTSFMPFFLPRVLAIPPGDIEKFGRVAWKCCIYTCLDLCHDHGREMILAALTQTNARETEGLTDIFKNLVSEWENKKRYKGQA